jgi:hypothetical protein
MPWNSKEHGAKSKEHGKGQNALRLALTRLRISRALHFETFDQLNTGEESDFDERRE